MEIIHKAAGIIIENKKILVERSVNKDHFIAPGGTIEKDEGVVAALIRELKEEFTIDVQKEDLSFFGKFEAKAAGQEEKTVIMEVYFVNKFEGQIKPNSEVEEVRWLDSTIPTNIKVGSIIEHNIIPELKRRNLID